METSANSSGPVIKELFKSLAILFVSTLVYGFFGLCDIFSIGVNFCSASAGQVSFIIGPLILVVFVVRGIKFYRRGNIKLVVISIAIPLLAFLLSSLYLGGSDALGGRIGNVFYPYSSIVTNKVQINDYDKMASDTEVNPIEICATRDSRSRELSPEDWMYTWVIEWKGSIKFPQGNIPVGYTQINGNGPRDGSSSLGNAYVETSGSGYQSVWDFQSDGEFHEWKVSYSVNPRIDFGLINPLTIAPKGSEYEIQFRFFDEAKRVYGKTYYTIIVPEPVTQKLFSLGDTQERYTRELTESERVKGTVCVTLKQ